MQKDVLIPSARICLVLAVADLGEGPGGVPPFLDQTEARRADKKFLETSPPPPPYLRVWMTRPPTPTPLSQGVDPALTRIFLAERQDDPSTRKILAPC